MSEARWLEFLGGLGHAFGLPNTVSHTTNWRPDPYGFHELRFFSADGKPTLLVMDGGKTSYDKPPLTDPSANPESQIPPLDPSPIMRPAASSISESALSSDQPATGAPHPESVKSQTNHSIALETTLGGIVHGSEEPLGQAAQRFPPVVVVHPNTNRAHTEMEPIGRPLKIAFYVVFGLLAMSALGYLVVHLRHSTTSSPHRTAAVTSSTTPAQGSTTTTIAIPTVLKPSAAAAAQALVSSWSTGNRLAALSVATPAATTTLFAAPYKSGSAVDRGCSTAFTPIVCTFGPPGGASPTDPIYQILVSQSSGGWYVNSVRIEH